MKPYVNYHKHSDYSNVLISDSVATLSDYVSRIKELGHNILSSCEHGTQGNVYLCDTLAKENNIKWRYVTEAYFVLDRFSKDKTNAHIILAAKNNAGRRAINAILSEANITGFYYKPRIDLELLLSLNPKDVFVTTACVAGIFKYGFDKASELIDIFHKHFGENFMLEVQYHNTPLQKSTNKFLLDTYYNKAIPLIFGADSHYIYPNEASLRDIRLADKGIVYEEEESWYMDYPDRDTAYQRFVSQGVLPHNLIDYAIDNTLIFNDFDDIVFDTSPKIPSLYPNEPYSKVCEIYTDKVHKAFNEYTKDMLPFDVSIRKQGMEYELDTIISGGMADYPLLTSEIVSLAKKNGGIITKTGRGSAPSFFTNMLLGFSSIDRFSMPVTMYPDRFISKDRLLAGSLPDIDHNVFNRQPFIEATRSLLGENSCYPMIAYGTLKRLSAWKMYCRACNVPFDVANSLSDRLKAYEIAMKHAQDPDEVNICDFVPVKYQDLLAQSEKYMGIVDSISPHPCAYLISSENIKEEIGIIRLKAVDENGATVYGACIDGAMADKYGYLKQDFLLVDVVGVNALAYQLAGVPMPSATELISLCNRDSATWDIFANGITCGINQVEKPKTTERVQIYKPHNITELSAFIASIRPAFASMLNIFLMRKPFSYHIPSLDSLITTREMPSSFLLYQEQLMKILQYGGLSSADSYLAIKAIAKKHPEKILPIKETFTKAFAEQIIKDTPGTRLQDAKDTTLAIWTIIEDSCSYLFNASHAISVALDGLYGAYCKAHYPLAYYSALLTIVSRNNDKERIARIKSEAQKFFNITFPPCLFGQDNRSFTINSSDNSISNTLKSIKFMSDNVAEELWSVRDFKGDFVDLLVHIASNTEFTINSRQIEILIRLGYFSTFGTTSSLLGVFYEFRQGKSRFSPSLTLATQQKRIKALKEILSSSPSLSLSPYQLIQDELKYLSQPIATLANAVNRFIVCTVEPFSVVSLYNISSGTIGSMRVKKDVLASSPLNVGDIISIDSWHTKPMYTYIDNTPHRVSGKSVFWLDSYSIVA